jgi:hypothetical protein
MSSVVVIVGAGLIVTGFGLVSAAAASYGLVLALLGGFDRQRGARVLEHILALGDTASERAVELDRILGEAQRRRLVLCDSRARARSAQGHG